MAEATRTGHAAPAALARDDSWLSLHVFYHGNLDRLLCAVIPPLRADLAAGGLADDLFFLRYWEGGNHVRLRARPRSPERADEVARLMRAHAERYLAGHPSPSVQGDADYTQLAAVLSAGERRAGYAPRLYPNNSVAALPYLSETERYGDGRSLAAVERHFVESSDLAIGVLAEDTGPARRAHLAFTLILLTWLIAEPSVRRLAAATVAVAAEPGARFGVGRAEFVGLTRRLRDVAGRLRATPPADPGLPARQASWSSSVLALRDDLAGEIAAGRFTPPEYGWRGPAGLRGEPGDTRALPVLDLCAHLVCNRLGVPIPEEGGLRHLAAHAVAAVVEEEGR